MLCCLFAGCSNDPEVIDQTGSNGSETKTVGGNLQPETDTPVEGHLHIAPNNGTLVVLGEEFAHLEFVLDADHGRLTAYALDGEAEKSIALGEDLIQVIIEKPKQLTLDLNPVENELTGEKIGSTSQFQVQHNDLKGLTEFDGKIIEVNVRGRKFKDVSFNFPKGNEIDHDHSH